MYAALDNDIDMDDDNDDKVLVSKDNHIFIDESEQIKGNDGDFYRGF